MQPSAVSRLKNWSQSWRYENIRVNFKVKTDEKNIEKLKALSKLSPVFDVTSHGTNVDVRIERK
jgi:hypothetical protein